jgi:hypothetical protein
MFRPVLRPSLCASIQKPYKERYNKHLKNPFVQSQFRNVKTYKYTARQYKPYIILKCIYQDFY